MEIIFHPEQVPPFYRRYVDHVKTFELLQAFEVSLEKSIAMIRSIEESKGDYAYAPGKWTIKEPLYHTLDAERVFCYRALCFSRNDKTELPAFDENAYVPESNANALTMQNILTQTINLRKTTMDLFSTFTPEMLMRTGVANKTQVSVIGLGYITAGHQLHHMDVLAQRYLQ